MGSAMEPKVDRREIFAAYEKAKETGILPAVHAEGSP